MSGPRFARVRALRGVPGPRKAVLLCLAAALDAGESPTIGSLAGDCGMSARMVADVLDLLKADGHLEAVIGPGWEVGQ